jgi:glycerol uptake facilitator-like aquaporin
MNQKLMLATVLAAMLGVASIAMAHITDADNICRSWPTDDYGSGIPDTYQDMLANSPQSSAFGGGCNMRSYIVAECKLHPNFTLGQAARSLIAKAKAGKQLPKIPHCGA